MRLKYVTDEPMEKQIYCIQPTARSLNLRIHLCLYNLFRLNAFRLTESTTILSPLRHLVLYELETIHVDPDACNLIRQSTPNKLALICSREAGGFGLSTDHHKLSFSWFASVMGWKC
jgi:hypothetical protein